MDTQHRVTARYYATLYKDISTVRAHINREFCTRYTDADIDRMLARKPTDSQPKKQRQLSNEPIAMHRPITTLRGGVDPLAVATNAYIEKYADKIRESLR
jgi:hypothetical protein